MGTVASFENRFEVKSNYSGLSRFRLSPPLVHNEGLDGVDFKDKVFSSELQIPTIAELSLSSLMNGFAANLRVDVSDEVYVKTRAENRAAAEETAPMPLTELCGRGGSVLRK